MNSPRPVSAVPVRDGTDSDSTVRHVHGVCPLDCPDTCSWVVTVENGRAVKLQGNREHPYTRGALCMKVNHYLEHARLPDRLLHPMRRVGRKGDGRFARIGWDEALDEVARQMRATPEIVFTTAYDRFAITAFELGAIDYLVKPFGRERFATTLARLRARLSPAAVPDRERAQAALEPGPLVRLFARHGDGIVPIAVSSILRIQAQGDYAEIHASEGVFLIHVSLSDLVARLDSDSFLQVHRSHIVNLTAVVRLKPYDERRLAIVLRDGSVVVASRAASERLRRRAR